MERLGLEDRGDGLQGGCFLVAVDPSAKNKYLFVGLVENPLISQRVKSKDPTQ